jgi:hypothetical protein
MIAGKLFTFGALLALAGQLTASAYFDQDELPSRVEYRFHMLRYIDNPAGRNDFVVSVHVPVIQLVKPEGIRLATVFVHIRYLGKMANIAFASKRGERTSV